MATQWWDEEASTRLLTNSADEVVRGRTAHQFGAWIPHHAVQGTISH